MPDKREPQRSHTYPCACFESGCDDPDCRQMVTLHEPLEPGYVALCNPCAREAGFKDGVFGGC